jgi:hypothetical protein
VSIVPLPDPCFDFMPLAFETSSNKGSGDGLGSKPYPPIIVTARLPADANDAKAQGGSGLGVKNRNWFWTDLTVGAYNLEGLPQLLWNNENRNYRDAHLLYAFREAARVYISWDDRHVKGGSDNPDGDVDNGWFDFNNDVGTVNAQGWLRVGGSKNDGAGTDILVCDGDDHFAQGGLWIKDVAPGQVLEFFDTGYDGGRSPYVIFVDCTQVCAKDEELALLEYATEDDLGIVVQGGNFKPAVVGGRLRVTDQGTGGSANAVWYGVPADPLADGAPLLREGFLVEFDAFMTRDIPANPADRNPADGMTFAAVATGENDGLASAVGPFPPGLDVPSLRGGGGGALGYEAHTLRERTEGHPSFAIEMDNWVGGGEPGTDPGDGGSPNNEPNYHLGVDVNASVSSIQTNVRNGVPTGELPDIFSPDGVHVEVMYRPDGAIDVWVSGVTQDGTAVTRRPVLSTMIPPLPDGDVVLGFTGGTGGATCTQEIDNFSLSMICCERPETVAISGPAEAGLGTTATYTAEITDGEVGATPTYLWEVVSGSATLANADQKDVDVTFESPGDLVLRVTANDGACAGSSADTTVTVVPPCDLTVDCEANDDNETVSLTVTVAGGDCDCDEIVVRRNGDEIFRGAPDAAELASLPLPEDCITPEEATYEVACAGPGAEGSADSCTVTCAGAQFIRGDCNQDGEVCRQVSDMVRMVEIIFLGTVPIDTVSCPAACDANGDGSFGGDLSDVLYTANYCFTGIEQTPATPLPPFPDCGSDKDTPLKCEPPTYCTP